MFFPVSDQFVQTTKIAFFPDFRGLFCNRVPWGYLSAVCGASRCRWALQPGLTAEKKRVAASGERNEHRRVASPRPGWRRRARPAGPQLTGWTTTGLLSQALPSRGESISFLSPARAAGAPTFCDATESRQRTQPRGLSPPWLSPTVFWPALSESSASGAHPPEAVQNPGWSAQRHRQGRRCKASRQVQPEARPRSPYDGPDARRNFAKKSPAFACRAAPEPAVARRLARATQRVAIVLLADQFPSALPEKPLRPTVSVRAPWEIISDKHIVYRFDFLLRRGARGFPPNFATQTQQKPLWGRSALESWSWLSNKLRLPYASGGLLRLREPRQNTQRVPPAGRAMLRIAWAIRQQKNILQLRSRAGSAYDAQARPQGVLLI